MLGGKNIFLLSHMRGNTSLLSHLLGSHDEIEGYYEMHLAYYSWKSLYRQKLLYTQEHTVRAGSRYFFDKILHNDHYIAPCILTRQNSKIIIMLRKPAQAIRSIVNLYQKTEPTQKYCDPQKAANYYIKRLQGIQIVLEALNHDYFYIQADELRTKPDQILPPLEKWLGLKSPIPDKYKNFKKTGKKGAGDSLKNIYTGKIIKRSTDYSSIKLEKESLKLAINTYHELVKVCQLNNDGFVKS